MKNIFRTLAILIAAFGAIMGTGCKENTLVSTKLSPNASNVATFDTFLSTVTKTYYDSNVVTSTYDGTAVYQGVGWINDGSNNQYFGTTSASTFLQLIPNLSPTFSFSGFTIDSAVLILPYSGFSFGDTTNQTATQTYSVYQLTDTLSLTTSYYPSSFAGINKLLGKATVNLYHLKDSVSVNGVNQAPHLRIRVDSVISLITNPAVAGFTNYPSEFINYFKGICIIPDTSGSNSTMPYFRLDGSDTYSWANILFYYHTTGATDTLTAQYAYFNPTYCAHFNNITHRYPSNSIAYKLLQSYQNNPNVSDSIIALQNKPGLGIDLKIHGITGLPNAVINKAELDIALLMTGSSIDNTFQLPPYLYPLGIASNDSAYIIKDLATGLSSQQALEDGYYHDYTIQLSNSNSIVIRTYAINIPAELQNAMVNRTDSLHLHITGTTNGLYGAYQLLAGGGTNTRGDHYKARLYISYSKLK